MKTLISMLKILTRTSCLGTAKCIFFKYLFEKKGDPFDYLPLFC